MSEVTDLAIPESVPVVLEAFLEAGACVIVLARLDDLRPLLTDLCLALVARADDGKFSITP